VVTKHPNVLYPRPLRKIISFRTGIPNGIFKMNLSSKSCQSFYFRRVAYESQIESSIDFIKVDVRVENE